jgi:hypothetical protein
MKKQGVGGPSFLPYIVASLLRLIFFGGPFRRKLNHAVS